MAQFRFDLGGSSTELKELVAKQESILGGCINMLLKRISLGDGTWPDKWEESFDQVEGLNQADCSL